MPWSPGQLVRHIDDPAKIDGALSALEGALTIGPEPPPPAPLVVVALDEASLEALPGPLALMHGEQLVTLLIEHDIGVRRTRHDLIELGENEEAEQ